MREIQHVRVVYPDGGCGKELLISHTNTGTSVRVYVATGRVSKSMDKKEQKAAEWLLRERVMEPSVVAT